VATVATYVPIAVTFAVYAAWVVLHPIAEAVAK
jgi:hypothetical protein